MKKYCVITCWAFSLLLGAKVAIAQQIQLVQTRWLSLEPAQNWAVTANVEGELSNTPGPSGPELHFLSLEYSKGEENAICSFFVRNWGWAGIGELEASASTSEQAKAQRVLNAASNTMNTNMRRSGITVLIDEGMIQTEGNWVGKLTVAQGPNIDGVMTQLMSLDHSAYLYRVFCNNDFDSALAMQEPIFKLFDSIKFNNPLRGNEQ